MEPGGVVLLDDEVGPDWGGQRVDIGLENALGFTHGPSRRMASRDVTLCPGGQVAGVLTLDHGRFN